jgi:hypothetical protein
MNGLLLPGDNNGSKLTAADQAALRHYPELHRLIELREGGWFFQPVPVAGELELVTGARVWLDGWSDAIAIRDLGDARAFRCDPVGGEVWKREGGLVEVIDGLVELPAPDDPGAPRLVKGRAPKLWTPASHTGMANGP